MEECLKSGINLLLIFVLSYSLARHSILWKNAFETIQAVFWSFCFAIKNHNGPNAEERRELCGILFQMLNICFRSLGVRRKQNWVYEGHSSLDFFVSLSPLPCSFSFLALFCFFFRVKGAFHLSELTGQSIPVVMRNSLLIITIQSY